MKTSSVTGKGTVGVSETGRSVRRRGVSLLSELRKDRHGLFWEEDFLQELEERGMGMFGVVSSVG